jgi:Cytotoxic
MDKIKVVHGQQVWANPRRTRFYTWDGLHGEIEVFDRRGAHLGAIDALRGIAVKDEDKTKKLDV